MIKDSLTLKIKMTSFSFIPMNTPDLRAPLLNNKVTRASMSKTIDSMTLKIKMISFRLDPNGFENMFILTNMYLRY